MTRRGTAAVARASCVMLGAAGCANGSGATGIIAIAVFLTSLGLQRLTGTP